MRWWLIPAIVVILFAASAEGALACSPPPERVRVQCGGASLEMIGSLTSAQESAALQPIREACPELAATLIPALNRETGDWRRTDFSYRFLAGSEVAYEPYAAERERSLLHDQEAVGGCTAPAFARFGDWLKIWQVQREYCTPPGLSLSRCPSLELRPSFALFVGYLIRHPSWATLPYLGIFLLVTGLIAIATITKVWVSKSARFITPNVGKLALSGGIAAVVCCAGSPLDVLLIVGVAYFLISLLPVDFSARASEIAL